MSSRYRAVHRGRLFNAMWPFTRYLFTNLTVAAAFVLFFILNRTRVIGRAGLCRRKNTLLLSNHQSMIDSFVVGMCAYYPYSWLKPYLIPWNPAAEENFYRTWWLAWLADQWKCIPIREGRRDRKALYRMMHALREGTMILFPEGTRSRDGRVGPGRPGAGLVALGNHPVLVPVAIDGMDRVLPVGNRLPRLGQRVYVYYGRPVDYSDLLDRPRSKHTAQELVDRTMTIIDRQHRAIRRLRNRTRRVRGGRTGS
ncbi:MAG: lysophospholipid acyltransferase family protein [Gemmatimonadota bacterium]